MPGDTPGKGLMELELPVEVWLAAERVPLGRLLDLESGDVLRLESGPDRPVDLVVDGTVVATGELVVTDGRLGFRVSRAAGIDAGELKPRGGSAS